MASPGPIATDRSTMTMAQWTGEQPHVVGADRADILNCGESKVNQNIKGVTSVARGVDIAVGLSFNASAQV